MKNVIVYVDGYNLYKTVLDLADVGCATETDLVWYDLRKIAEKYLEEGDELSSIRFYTAKPLEGKGKHNPRIFTYWIKEILKKRVGSTIPTVVIKGKFRGTDGAMEEKQTDVNIALDLICGAGVWLNSKDSSGRYSKRIEYDKAMLISGDTDFVPAIRCVLDNCPKKSIVRLKSNSQDSDVLKDTRGRFHPRDFTMADIEACLFPPAEIAKFRSEAKRPELKLRR